MLAILRALGMFAVDMFKSRSQLEDYHRFAAGVTACATALHNAP
jgi:hypothetical protein